MIMLKQGNCLDLMENIGDKSIDMILCDLPYGSQTKNKWDIQIPFEPLWEQYLRIIKDSGAIVLFANGMFTAQLMLSQPKLWRYNLIWDKAIAGGFLNANRMPLRKHEDICVFYKKPPTYNPQKFEGKPNHSRGNLMTKGSKINNNYGEYGWVDNREKLGNLKHPTSIITISKDHPSTMIHPTQKPVELLEWLIKTYTNEGDIVLDNCMGSGSCGIAAVNTNRNFIGIELNEEYFKQAKQRIEASQKMEVTNNDII